MEISPNTYRLIAGSVTDGAIEVDGESIPIRPENREKIAAAVESARERSKAAPEAAARAPRVGGRAFR